MLQLCRVVFGPPRGNLSHRENVSRGKIQNSRPWAIKRRRSKKLAEAHDSTLTAGWKNAKKERKGKEKKNLARRYDNGCTTSHDRAATKQQQHRNGERRLPRMTRAVEQWWLGLQRVFRPIARTVVSTAAYPIHSSSSHAHTHTHTHSYPAPSVPARPSVVFFFPILPIGPTCHRIISVFLILRLLCCLHLAVHTYYIHTEQIIIVSCERVIRERERERETERESRRPRQPTSRKEDPPDQTTPGLIRNRPRYLLVVKIESRHLISVKRSTEQQAPTRTCARTLTPETATSVGHSGGKNQSRQEN